MRIDPNRLRDLRKKQKLSLVKLAEKTKRVNPPGITEKTIQRLEAPSQQNATVREHTIESLAKALSVEPGVLTGDLPLPESDDTLTDNLNRVQIGAQIAPKTRLAYDLIKRRYGVNATEIINMAPLFFTLLAEGSLAWRRKKLKEVEDMLARLDEIRDTGGAWSAEFSQAAVLAEWGSERDEDSIASADIFGVDLLEGGVSNIPAFEPVEINPFADYLRNFAGELAVPDVVDVDKGDLNFRSQYKFPDYEVGRKELDHISNGSSKARRTLETGHVRLSEIPEELMGEDAGERRVKWLEDKLPFIYDMAGGDSLAETVAKDTDPDLKQKIEDMESKHPDLKQKIEDMESKHPDLKQKIMESQKVDSQKTNSETEKEGDDQ